jgi:hypothetical protein
MPGLGGMLIGAPQTGVMIEGLDYIIPKVLSASIS